MSSSRMQLKVSVPSNCRDELGFLDPFQTYIGHLLLR
jgi:hypothetical protein